MQDGPLFGNVDLVSAKHGINTGPQTGFLGQLQEEFERFIGDAVLGVIEVDADRLGGKALSAFGVVREELSEVHLSDHWEMGFECLPRRALSEWCDVCGHAVLLWV